MNAATLTPTWLRQPRENGVLPLSAALGPVLADALEWADSDCRSFIECSCQPTSPAPEWWWDTTKCDAGDAQHVAHALRYLDARGLIERAPGEPHVVRMVDVAREAA